MTPWILRFLSAWEHIVFLLDYNFLEGRRWPDISFLAIHSYIQHGGCTPEWLARALGTAVLCQLIQSWRMGNSKTLPMSWPQDGTKNAMISISHFTVTCLYLYYHHRGSQWKWVQAPSTKRSGTSQVLPESRLGQMQPRWARHWNPTDSARQSHCYWPMESSLQNRSKARTKSAIEAKQKLWAKWEVMMPYLMICWAPSDGSSEDLIASRLKASGLPSTSTVDDSPVLTSAKGPVALVLSSVPYTYL